MWNRLGQVKCFTLHVYRECAQWEGKGDIIVIKESPSVLVFQETGSWVTGSDQIATFHNRLRLKWNRAQETISIEHLRLHTPVFLVDLVATQDNLMTSMTPHLCGSDTYQAQITWDADAISLNWQVIGQKKNERIEYRYFADISKV